MGKENKTRCYWLDDNPCNAPKDFGLPIYDCMRCPLAKSGTQDEIQAEIIQQANNGYTVMVDFRSKKNFIRRSIKLLCTLKIPDTKIGKQIVAQTARGGFTINTKDVIFHR